ncbi:MAG TPA: ABC transporter permease, partial [Candidatus Aminicenantes bacterium]|nr:ABC transporter permease [Candidatus Aminicenantes bacterium]
MKKFTNLLRKEIKELVTKQLIVSLVLFIVLFNFIGQVSKKEVQKAIGVQPISALDEDGSAASKALLKGLESARFKVLDQSGKTKDDALETARAGGSKLLLVIPKGFGGSLAALQPIE